MKLLVFGKSGQLARELERRVPDAVFLSRDDADLLKPDVCAQQVERYKPDAVIIAAAWTAVDAAEDNRDAAEIVNGKTPGAIAVACAGFGIPLVHVSTDYVFDGTGTEPWMPDDATAPLGVYGATKRAGERAIVDAGGVHAILRTSWVVSAHGANFIKTMLRLSESRDALSIVGDQIGGPTPAADLADACLAAAQGLTQDAAKSGIYHFAGAPDVSWADFARAIFDLSGRQVAVTDIPSEDYPTPAARPKNSRLDCRSFEANFDLKRPNWRHGLEGILRELNVL